MTEVRRLDTHRACLEIWVYDELVTGLYGRHAPETCTYGKTAPYCKFENVREVFIFAKFRENKNLTKLQIHSVVY